MSGVVSSSSGVAACCGHQKIGVIPKIVKPFRRSWFGLALMNQGDRGWSFLNWEIRKQEPPEHSAIKKFNSALGWELDSLRFGLAFLGDCFCPHGEAGLCRLYWAHPADLLPNQNGLPATWQWFDQDQIVCLIARGLAYAAGRMGPGEWQANPGLDPEWALLINKYETLAEGFGWQRINPDSEFDWS